MKTFHQYIEQIQATSIPQQALSLWQQAKPEYDKINAIGRQDPQGQFYNQIIQILQQMSQTEDVQQFAQPLNKVTYNINGIERQAGGILGQAFGLMRQIISGS